MSRPGTGTRAYRALEQLHRAGGNIGRNQWMRACQWTGTTSWFEGSIAHVLIDLGMVVYRDSTWRITPAGLARLDVELDAPPMTPPTVVGPRYVAPIRPLAAANMTRLTLTRPEAFDYQAIPSRMADQRIAHGSKA